MDVFFRGLLLKDLFEVLKGLTGPESFGQRNRFPPCRTHLLCDQSTPVVCIYAFKKQKIVLKRCGKQKACIDLKGRSTQLCRP